MIGWSGFARPMPKAPRRVPLTFWSEELDLVGRDEQEAVSGVTDVVTGSDEPGLALDGSLPRLEGAEDGTGSDEDPLADVVRGEFGSQLDNSLGLDDARLASDGDDVVHADRSDAVSGEHGEPVVLPRHDGLALAVVGGPQDASTHVEAIDAVDRDVATEVAVAEVDCLDGHGMPFGWLVSLTTRTLLALL